MKIFETINHIISQFQNGVPKPLYLIAGSERFFSSEIILAAEKYLVSPSNRSFNFDIFYSDETDGSHVLSTCLSLPMMNGFRVVIVHDFEKLSLADPQRFSQYLNTPEPKTVLILVANKIDKRKKLYSILEKKALFLDASPITKEHIVINWIHSYLQSQNKKIIPQALRILYEHIGNNLFELKNQMEKIITYKAKETSITTEDIENLVGVSKEYNSFEMSEAILTKRKERTLKILNMLLEQGEEPIKINGALFYRFNKQWCVHQLVAHKKGNNEITRKVGIHPYFLKSYLAPTNHYTKEQIENALQIIVQTDVKLKTENTNPKQIIQLAIQEILCL